jgi:hypothetical protein
MGCAHVANSGTDDAHLAGRGTDNAQRVMAGLDRTDNAPPVMAGLDPAIYANTGLTILFNTKFANR